MPTAHRNLATGRLSEIHRGQCPPAPEGAEIVRLARMPDGRGPWAYDEATQLAVAAAPTRAERLGAVALPEALAPDVARVLAWLLAADPSALDGAPAGVRRAAQNVRDAARRAEEAEGA